MRERRRPRLSDRQQQNVWGLAFLAPALLLVCVFLLVPIFEVLAYSFTDWDGRTGKFIGLANYAEIFSNPDFYTILRNNLYVLALGVTTWTLLPLAVALICFEEIRGWSVFKTVYFFPGVLSIAIVGVLFSLVFQYSGLFNALLQKAGLGALAVDWLGKGATSIPIIVLAVNWAGFGRATLILLAAMCAIDTNMYEAAALDGASWLRRAWHITIPGIRNTLEFVVIIHIIDSFSNLYAYVMTITNGGPGYESTVLEYFIYLQGFRAGRLGYACGVAVILLVIVLSISLLFRFYAARKEA